MRGLLLVNPPHRREDDAGSFSTRNSYFSFLLYTSDFMLPTSSTPNAWGLKLIVFVNRKGRRQVITVSNQTEKAELNEDGLFVGTPELANLLNGFARANTTLVNLPYAVRLEFELLGYTVEADEWELPEGWVQ